MARAIRYDAVMGVKTDRRDDREWLLPERPPIRLKLIDVVVLAGLIVFTLLVLMVMLWRVRPASRGTTCAMNVSAIGKAMFSYAHDYNGRLPCAGGPGADWVARLPWWAAQARADAYGITDVKAPDGKASVSASLYLLVKLSSVGPEVFVCDWDSAATTFDPMASGLMDRDLSSLWDFGPEPPRHCSYAYHMPYGPDRLTVARGPAFPIVADRNPWIDSPAGPAKEFGEFEPDIPPFDGARARARRGNTTVHRENGQNVLFLDGRVEFAIRSYCGIDADNIYTLWKDGEKVKGVAPRLGALPAGLLDSFLVNDPAVAARPQ